MAEPIEPATSPWTDRDLLNRALEADPELARNMQEMGYIKWTPFIEDYKGDHSTGCWEMTEYGRKEMGERDEAMAMFEANLQAQLDDFLCKLVKAPRHEG